jgi:hypothetical protein
MMTCDELSQCAFYETYSQEPSFRKQHFNYFCCGPLAETCARRSFRRQHGSAPRPDFSPLGAPLMQAG